MSADAEVKLTWIHAPIRALSTSLRMTPLRRSFVVQAPQAQMPYNLFNNKYNGADTPFKK